MEARGATRQNESAGGRGGDVDVERRKNRNCVGELSWRLRWSWRSGGSEIVVKLEALEMLLKSMVEKSW